MFWWSGASPIRKLLSKYVFLKCYNCRLCYICISIYRNLWKKCREYMVTYFKRFARTEQKLIIVCKCVINRSCSKCSVASLTAVFLCGIVSQLLQVNLLSTAENFQFPFIRIAFHFCKSHIKCSDVAIFHSHLDLLTRSNSKLFLELFKISVAVWPPPLFIFFPSPRFTVAVVH